METILQKASLEVRIRESQRNKAASEWMPRLRTGAPMQGWAEENKPSQKPKETSWSEEENQMRLLESVTGEEEKATSVRAVSVE